MRRPSASIVVFTLIIVLTFLHASSQEVSHSSSQNSISSLRARAENGDVEAQRQLGIAYDQGEGVQQDYQQALKWYLKAAEQNDAVAENNIGVLYRLGNGVPKNFDTAVSWYAKAARKELPAALMNFGIAHYNGEGVPEDRVQAYGWLSLSAEQGYQPAKDGIASIRRELSECDILSAWDAIALAYEIGQALPKNPEKAVHWYQKAAEHGDPSAQVRLSHILQVSDPSTAASWRERAIKQNFAPAMYDMGQIYETGVGVDRDPKLAVKWYTKAFQAADPRGAEALGRLYLTGTGVNPDRARAYRYFYSAATSGLQAAVEEANSLQKTLSESEKREIGKIRDIPFGLRPDPVNRCSAKMGSGPSL